MTVPLSILVCCCFPLPFSGGFDSLQINRTKIESKSTPPDHSIISASYCQTPRPIAQSDENTQCSREARNGQANLILFVI